MRISVVGLGKLGLCSAACFAFKGHSVIGVDVLAEHVDALNKGQCPIDETGLEDLLDAARPNMRFVTDAAQAVNETDATLIIVPTPSEEDGAFTNAYIEAVLRDLAPAIKSKSSFHIVDVVSTVMPRSCEETFRPLLEEMTGKSCGVDFGLVYNPEFIALGSVIRDFLNPDMVLIGASDKQSAAFIRELYASMVESQPQYSIMSLTNAEVTKLSLNCFVTMKISFANELANVCESIAGADIDVVTDAIGADTRVGKKYLKGGLGFGGPCFPRDNRALQRAATLSKAPMHLSPNVLMVNDGVVETVIEALSGRIGSADKVAVYGLPYKQGTHILEESQSIMLAEELLNKGYEVHLHDPKAMSAVDGPLREKAVFQEDPYAAAEGAAALVFMTDWPQFAELDLARLEEAAMNGGVLYDSWRIFKGRPMSSLTYIGRGVGPKE